MHVTTADSFASVIIESIEDETLRFRPDRRGHMIDEPWFWWAFRLHPHGRRQVFVEATSAYCFTTQGVAICIDDGDWQWTGADSLTDDRCRIAVPADCQSLAIAMSMPYQDEQWQACARGLAADTRVRPGQLTVSAAGRSVPVLHLGSAMAPRWGLLTCRHHACEASASWVLEGFIKQVLSDPSWCELLAGELRLLVVPFVDTDGVAESTHGKNRAPHDHNRDYQSERYPEVTAIKKLFDSDGAADALAFALDLHAPWIRGARSEGAWNEHVYVVGSADETLAARQRSLSAHWERCHQGVLPFDAAGYLAYGTAWNTGAVTTPQSCGRWVADQAPEALVATMEFPYATVDGVATSPEALAELGGSLALATLAELSESSL